MSITPQQVWDLMASGDMADAQTVLDNVPEILQDYFKAHAALLRVREATSALALLAEAWRHLKLDTPQDQQLHEQLLNQTDSAVSGMLAVLDA